MPKQPFNFRATTNANLTILGWSLGFSTPAFNQSGHPILIVPYVQKAAFDLDRVLILWDGSATATRAIVGAMPFLHRAQQIDLISIVGERDVREELAGVDMVCRDTDSQPNQHACR